MTSINHSSPGSGESDDLLELPQHDTPWIEAGYRDQDARLLVNAMHRQRDRLMRDAPDVPVQGYEVLDAERGESGALSCGTLISLWRCSPLCRGACPVCGELALAFTIGGKGTDWQVLGVCLYCAQLVHRPSEKSELIAELDGSLRGTRFALPNAHQLLSSNGHQHTALLGALSECGELLLPPLHYGFLASMPKAMRGWPNQMEPRAWHWTCNVTVRHAPTGAMVELTESILRTVTLFMMQHLTCTGRLPELEHDGECGLQYCFPMISQEPVVLARDAETTDEEWSDPEVPDEEQS